jgi:hypothetical protein
VGNKCEKLGVGVGRDGLCLLRLAVLALVRRSPRWRCVVGGVAAHSWWPWPTRAYSVSGSICQ